eukprot:11236539-Heterocapsa_arctica.AAC.1
MGSARVPPAVVAARRGTVSPNVFGSRMSMGGRHPNDCLRAPGCRQHLVAARVRAPDVHLKNRGGVLP